MKWYIMAVVGTLSAWWFIRRVMRTFEDRCPDCGRLIQWVTYYMTSNTTAPHGLLVGRHHETYKFLRCSRRRCQKLRCDYRERYVSYIALWLKYAFKPWHFRKTAKVRALMLEMGFESPRKLLIHHRCRVWVCGGDKISSSGIKLPPKRFNYRN